MLYGPEYKDTLSPAPPECANCGDPITGSVKILDGDPYCHDCYADSMQIRESDARLWRAEAAERKLARLQQVVGEISDAAHDACAHTMRLGRVIGLLNLAEMEGLIPPRRPAATQEKAA